jgi:hypothetical protein
MNGTPCKDEQGVDAELLEIAGGAEKRPRPDHPLTIQVVQARLHCAAAAHDPSLSEIRAERLATLRYRRGERFRREAADDPDEISACSIARQRTLSSELRCP